MISSLSFWEHAKDYNTVPEDDQEINRLLDSDEPEITGALRADEFQGPIYDGWSSDEEELEVENDLLAPGDW